MSPLGMGQDRAVVAGDFGGAHGNDIGDERRGLGLFHTAIGRLSSTQRHRMTQLIIVNVDASRVSFRLRDERQPDLHSGRDSAGNLRGHE